MVIVAVMAANRHLQVQPWNNIGEPKIKKKKREK